MDYYSRVDDREEGLLSSSSKPAAAHNGGKPDLSAPSSSHSDDGASSLTSFSPLPSQLHERLFPPTVLARALWLLAFFLLFAFTLIAGYEIGKRLTPSSSTSSPPPPTPSKVVLISIDGFRASYLDDYPAQLPTLRSMRRSGAWAQRMISCYPSTTFPNHWSIVTGLYTPQHGIVSNSMFDPTLNASFNMQTLDSRWWGGEPVWNTAMKQGRRANVLFWPGSEVEVQGMRPTYWAPYNGSMPNAARITSLLGWLRTGTCELCVSYFDLVDGAGHSAGPNSTQVANALATVDGLVAALLQGIYELGQQEAVTVLLVSDHGMAAIDQTARSIILDDYTDVSRFRLIDNGALLGLWPNDPADAARIFSDLQGKNPNLVMMDPALAASMHYTGNVRIPPVTGMVADGWVVRTRARGYGSGGTHGYDPRFVSMGALFLGQGKGLKKGGVVDQVENVNVYSLICHLLGIEPAATSGSLDLFKGLLE